MFRLVQQFVPLLILPFLGCARPQSAPAVLTIEAAPQQTIRGWGIYPCTIRNDRPNAQLYTLWHRPNASRLIWRDLNITYWRSEIYARLLRRAARRRFARCQISR